MSGGFQGPGKGRNEELLFNGIEFVLQGEMSYRAERW